MFRSSKTIFFAVGLALTLPIACQRQPSDPGLSDKEPVVATPTPAPVASTQESASAEPGVGSAVISAAPFRRFAFGPDAIPPGKENFVRVGPSANITPDGPHGWLAATGDANGGLNGRDRGSPDPLRRTFVYGKGPRTFRIAALTPGRYKLSIVSGDQGYGDHVTEVAVNGGASAFPVLKPGVAEFATLTAIVEVKGETLDLMFRSPTSNWVVNYLTLEPTKEPAGAPRVTVQRFGSKSATNVKPAKAAAVKVAKATPATPKPKPSPTLPPKAVTLPSVAEAADPTAALLNRFRQAAKTPNTTVAAAFTPTGLRREAYLDFIGREVDFWRKHQNRDGAIIDPYLKQEFQYSTPAYAHAAATLVAYGGRKDLVESAAKATDWAVRSLSQRRAANHHEDFYAPMLAHALQLLKPQVASERLARWEGEIRSFSPQQVYRVGAGGNNWNVVALAGEARFQKMGLRSKSDTFVSTSLGAQKNRFVQPFGLYAEGPMPYDHFPRTWAADMLADGYDGPYRQEMAKALRKAAITSLFMQSPWGELPAGGRSSHHQWNEAEQCVTFEIYAADALKAGDKELAGAYKRAAHLALASMRRWVRPSGEMQIVKNWVDPAKHHGFESYSAHSQYNLLPMAMLAMAYEHAAPTESLAETMAPTDLGGYVLPVEGLHKVFANVAGMYVELDTMADMAYDSTGLVRIHSRLVSPQLGPSDGILPQPHYRRPKNARPLTNPTGVGISWQEGGNGEWRRMGELDRSRIRKTRVIVREETPARVVFDVVYDGDLFGVSRIIEHYTLEAGHVSLTTEIPGYTGPLRYVWPVLAHDGATKSDIKVVKGMVIVTQDGGKTAQTFTPVSAATVRVESTEYPNRNGWARLGVAEFAAKNGKATLVIAPRSGV